MPPKADVDIRLRAETGQAERQLKAVSKELKASAQAGQSRGGAQTARPAAQALGDPVGKAIGKAMVGYVAHEGLSALTALVGSRPGGRLWSQRLATVGGSTVGGATAGAVAGSAIPGFGTAIGAAAGALAGAVTGFVKTLSEETRSFRDAMRAIDSAHLAAGNTQTLGRQDRAFERLQSFRQRPEQAQAVRERLSILRFGSGPNSIASLQKRILKAEKSGQTDSVEYLNDKDLFARQKGREAALLRKLEDLKLPAAGQPLAAREVSDRLGAIGGQVGAQVNVADVNQRQLDVLRQIYEKISAPGRQSPDAATPFFDKSFYE